MTKGSTVLIVEDEMVISLEIAATLKRLGYQIAGQAITGEEAIRLAEAADPDLVLMDIRLKGDMDGIEAACQIKEKFDLPVIFLTAHSDEATLERAIAISPSGYLIKPFKDRELYSSIELALHKHDIRQRIRPCPPVCRTESSDYLDTPGVCTLLISPRGIIVRTSQSCCSLFGSGQADICGTRISGWLVSASGAGESGSLPVMGVLPGSAVLRRQDGELIPVRIEAGFLLRDDGSVQGFIFSLITAIMA